VGVARTGFVLESHDSIARTLGAKRPGVIKLSVKILQGLNYPESALLSIGPRFLKP
jgi:hypothetical protein